MSREAARGSVIFSLVFALSLVAGCTALAVQPATSLPSTSPVVETPLPRSSAAPSVAVTPATPAATSTPAPTSTAAPTATVRPSPTVAGPARTGKSTAPSVSASFAVVLDEISGQVLYEKNARTRTPPASVTKIMTALVALERGKPADRVKVSFDPASLDPDSTLMGVRPGDEVTLEDLLYGLMLPSGNDAALAIAVHVAGSEDAFVQLMNERARELGLRDTQFKNPHGLHATGHYSTAYDMTTLARHAMLNQPFFVKLSAAKYREVKGKRSYELYNLNRLLTQYKGGDGVKVGFTEEAGKTFVGSATRDGHRVYVGLMKSANLWDDAPPLLDWAFGNFTWSAR